MPRDKLLAFVKTLAVDLQHIFDVADEFAKVTDDTGCDDFQIAAAVLDAFDKQAEQSLGLHQTTENGILSD